VALHNVRILHESIDASPERVYAFVADPVNMPRWAPNFGHRIRRDGDAWVMETADGPFRVRFAPDNDLGVLDHWVTPPGGAEIHNPMRVVANGTGSVISFTLVQQGDWSDEQLAADAGLVAADLARLRSLIEAESTPIS
jgi:uncharacterized protein YndB with AHSA1/START domain